MEIAHTQTHYDSEFEQFSIERNSICLCKKWELILRERASERRRETCWFQHSHEEVKLLDIRKLFISLCDWRLNVSFFLFHLSTHWMSFSLSLSVCKCDSVDFGCEKANKPSTENRQREKRMSVHQVHRHADTRRHPSNVLSRPRRVIIFTWNIWFLLTNVCECLVAASLTSSKHIFRSDRLKSQRQVSSWTTT